MVLLPGFLSKRTVDLSQQSRPARSQFVVSAPCEWAESNRMAKRERKVSAELKPGTRRPWSIAKNNMQIMPKYADRANIQIMNADQCR